MVSRFWIIISTCLNFLSHRFSRTHTNRSSCQGPVTSHRPAFIPAPKPLIFVAFAVYLVLNDQKECPQES